MSKLFNIQNVKGGDIINQNPFNITADDKLKDLINLINEENLPRFKKIIQEKNENEKDKNKVFLNYSNNISLNVNTLTAEEVKNILINELLNKENKDIEPQRKIELLEALREFERQINTPLNPVNKVEVPLIIKETAKTTGCIHIGIIDETGTFVGVQSISNNNLLFQQLHDISVELKKINNNKLGVPPFSIYDQFVEKSDNDCNPTLVSNYSTLFWESKELFENYDIYQNQKDGNNLRYSYNNTSTAYGEQPKIKRPGINKQPVTRETTY